jgi:hypothetical protein
MKVTWNGSGVELDVEGNPLHAALAQLVADHGQTIEFREHLETTAQTPIVALAKMYADGKRDGLGAAITAVIKTVVEVPVH